MYAQINPTEIFRERQLALLGEADNRRLARRSRRGGGQKGRSARRGVGALSPGLMLAVLVVVAGIVLVGFSGPAQAETTFTVNSTGDEHDLDFPGSTFDGSCSTGHLIGQSPECSLRAALEEANFASGAISTINFDIPGSGVKTISPNSQLPFVTEQVTIDGYTQPGAKANTLAKGTNAALMIELDGSNAGLSSIGLELASNAHNCVIRGLVINRFAGEGISIHDASAKDNRVEGNFIGTDPSGTIDLGNSENGVSIVEASGNTVGGTTPEARNLISGNHFVGVAFFGSAINKVEGNLIGTQKDGLAPLGNGQSGVFINTSSNNTVGGATPAAANTIAFNGFDGVALNTGTGNRILFNSIFSNNGAGIDLADDGPTPNDGDDPATFQPDADKDTGTNNLQNFPVLSSAKTSRKGTTIKGNLNSLPGAVYTLQFFSNPPGTDEGARFIGQRSVPVDASGDATFAFKTKKKVGVGQAITATATNEFTGDTSEFSAPKAVMRAR